jgi:putative transposase
MTFNPKIHHRRSIRLREYDYSQNGLYFVTICTRDRLLLFGAIADGLMNLSSMGQIAQEEWFKTARIRAEIRLHEFVVMPNHIHGIIEITGDVTLGKVVRGYKSAVTAQINSLAGNDGIAVWQRNYYEHIIRDEQSYQNISAYIQTNPQRWLTDTYWG